MVKRIDPLPHTFLIGVDEHLDPFFLCNAVTKCGHLPEFPCRVDVQKRERGLFRVKCLHGKVQHDRAVLPNGIQHDRFLTLRRHFPHDVYCFCLEGIKMGVHSFSSLTNLC